MRILFIILMMFVVLQGCGSGTNKTSKNKEVKNDVKVTRIHRRVSNGFYLIEYEGTKYLLYRDYETGAAIIKHVSLDEFKKNWDENDEKIRKIMGY